MALTYVLIASSILGSNSATITFSSIPQTYTDLVLQISGRNSSTGSLALVRLNNNSSAVYPRTQIATDFTTVSSSRSTTQTEVQDYMANSFFAANLFSVSEVYIPNYTLTQTKQLSNISFREANNTTDAYAVCEAILNTSTSPVTSLTITSSNSNNFVTNSSFYLYGIKNS